MLTVTADELPRIVACNGSLAMPKHQDFQPDDTMRREGDAAHWLIEQLFNQHFTADELIDRQAPNGVFITSEMVEHVTPTLDLWGGRGTVEVVTSYGDGQNYQVNGRADRIEYENGSDTLYVDDFKYGWNPIEPEMNWTLLSHAFGWLFQYPLIAQTFIRKVVVRISQPRPYHSGGNIRKATYTIEQLWEMWPTLEATLTKPTGELVTGQKQCYKCPALATCPAAQKAGMNAIEISEMAFVAEMTDAELAFLLLQSERAKKVLDQNLKAYTELALHRLKAGRLVPGYAAERSMSNKAWKKGIDLTTAHMLTGQDLSDAPKMITPAQAVKRGVPESIVDSLCERHEKGVTLAKIDAKKAVEKNFGSIL